MGNLNSGLYDALYKANKVAYPLALSLIVTAFTLGWIGFAVPDWLSFTNIYNYQSKFGLWNVCSLSLAFYSNGFECVSWKTGTTFTYARPGRFEFFSTNCKSDIILINYNILYVT